MLETLVSLIGDETLESHTTHDIIMHMSENVLSADNQQERAKRSINPWYIVGFVEGEGTFHIALYKDPRMK